MKSPANLMKNIGWQILLAALLAIGAAAPASPKFQPEFGASG